VNGEDLPIMCFFVRDEMAEVAPFDAAERGVVASLKNNLWAAGGELPADARRLARMCGVDLDAWPALWGAVRHVFVEAGGKITHTKLSAEMARAREQREAHRRGADLTNAQRSAQRGAERGAERSAERADSGSDSAPPCDTPPSPSPSGSPSVAPSPSPASGRKRSPATPAGAPSYSATFEEIWEKYPKKVAKADAWRTFQKIAPPPDQVLAALTWQCESRAWQDVNFVPHLTTYLNRQQWEDQPNPANGAGHVGPAAPDADHVEGPVDLT
jgi:uncharacterized protein YdaU (DUF1376 family)